MQLTRSSSLSKLPKKTLYSSIIPNTQTVLHRKVPSGEIRLPHNPDHKRDMRNEVPIKTLVYRNENMDTVARNYSKRDEGDENFAAHFFTNSLKRFERDYSKEVREKLIDEYKKENPDAYVKLHDFFSKFHNLIGNSQAHVKPIYYGEAEGIPTVGEK